MKIKVCDICYYESSVHNPKLIRSIVRSSLKNGVSAIRLDLCKDHQNWLKERDGKTMNEIQTELDDMQDKYFKGAD